MDYKIVDKPTFKVVGKSIRASTKDGENLRQITQFWQESAQDGTVSLISDLADQLGVLGDVILGICTDFAPDMSEFTYMIAAESPPDGAPDAMTETEIPALTWAVFEARGPMPDAIQNVWGGIWSEFFTASPYKHGDGPDLEIYPCGDPNEPGYIAEVWVPVVKK